MGVCGIPIMLKNFTFLLFYYLIYTKKSYFYYKSIVIFFIFSLKRVFQNFYCTFLSLFYNIAIKFQKFIVYNPIIHPAFHMSILFLYFLYISHFFILFLKNLKKSAFSVGKCENTIDIIFIMVYNGSITKTTEGRR